MHGILAVSDSIWIRADVKGDLKKKCSDTYVLAAGYAYIGEVLIVDLLPSIITRTSKPQHDHRWDSGATPHPQLLATKTLQTPTLLSCSQIRGMKGIVSGKYPRRGIRGHLDVTGVRLGGTDSCNDLRQNETSF